MKIVSRSATWQYGWAAALCLGWAIAPAGGQEPAPATPAAPTTPATPAASEEAPASEKAPATPAAEQPAPAAENAQAEQPAATPAEPPAAEKTAAEQPAAEQPAAEKPAAEQPAVDKPAAEKPAAEKPAGERPAAREGATDKPAGREASDDVRLEFSFRYAPWKDVLEWFAEQANLSLMADATPPGTFNYTDTRQYSPAEAIDLLNSVLQTKGFMLVRKERILMLVNVEDKVPENLVTRIPVDELDKHGESEFAVCLFDVQRVTPEEAEQELQKLIGRQGTVRVLPKSKQVLVTDTVGRLRTIRDVIRAIEDPGAAGRRMESIPVTNVSAAEALMVMRPLLGLTAEENASADGSLRVAVDPSGQRLLVESNTAGINRVKEAVKLIEQGASRSIADSPQLEVYSTGTLTGDSVLRVLQTILAGEKDVRMEIEPTTGNLIVQGRPKHHATVRATLDQMLRDTKEMEVIPLHRLEPQVALLAVNKMFGGAGTPAANAPKVDADPVNSQLIVQGTRSQIDQIRGLLGKMGESPDEASGYGPGRGNVRVLPYSNSQMDDLLGQAVNIWPSMRKNRIREVTPSAITPSMRDGGAATPSNSGRIQLRPRREPLFPPRTDATAGAESESADEETPVRRPERQAPAAEDEAPRTTPRLPSPRLPANQNESRTQGTEAQPPAPDGESVGYTGRVRIRYVQRNESSEPAAADERPARRRASQEETEGAEQNELPEVLVSRGPNGLIISSEDPEALDAFEELLTTLEGASVPAGSQFTVFYLKYSKAQVAADLLKQIISGSTSSTSSGGLLGGLGGGSLFDSLMSAGGGSLVGGNVVIIPDARLNLLIVQGAPAEIELVEDLLTVIDRAFSEEANLMPAPRLIPIVNSDPEQIANVIRQVYASRINGGQGGGQGGARAPTPEDFIRAIRGGGGGGGGGRGGGGAQSEEQMRDVTIGVDTQSRSLVVSAPDPVFEQIRDLVNQLDVAGQGAGEVMQVIPLQKSNPEMVQRAVAALIGQQQSGTTQRPQGNQGQGGFPGGGFGPNQGGFTPEMMNAMRAQQGGGGGFGGGGFGGGGGGFGGGGGGRGGGGFGGGGFGGGGGGRGGGGFGGGGFGGGGGGRGGGGGGGGRGGGG